MTKRLSAELAGDLALNAWSGFWTLVALGIVGAIYYLETGYVSFDKEAEEYIVAVDRGLLLLRLYGAGLIATGLAIAPLYRRDEHEVGRVAAEDE